MLISCIIPAKDREDPKLKDLIASIQSQDFPKKQIEILIITEGDSESAKSIGIRKSTGKILCMLCADNLILSKSLFSDVKRLFDKYPNLTGVYSSHYSYSKTDNSLNRYFSLMGVNDPVPFYLGKADRKSHLHKDESVIFDIVQFKEKIPSLGDNCFFVRSELFKMTHLDHYYPMDACEDLRRLGEYVYARLYHDIVWHRTSDSLINFLKKRYRYAKDLYSNRTDRRWKMLDTRKDYWKLAGFILATLTVVQPLSISIRGYRYTRDCAWFWHWPVCLGFVITYGILACRNLLKFRSLFQLSEEAKVLKPV